MAITKDQRLCCLLSICLGIVIIVLGLAITTVYCDQQQQQEMQNKNNRILELEKIFENEPDVIPSNNTVEYIQNCGQGFITHFNKEKNNVTCELHCSFTELLTFLEKYNVRPGKIQSVHITRDNGLQVSLTLFSPQEEK